MSYFQNALNQLATWEVGMNQVLFVPFNDEIGALGTQNLNGCTAVVIASPKGAILAHIPPIPYPTFDSTIGMQNLDRLMDQMISLYCMHATMFSFTETAALIVAPYYEGELALEHHLHRIESILQANALPPFVNLYSVSLGGHTKPADGTVFIESWPQQVSVYVEDNTVLLHQRSIC